MVPFESFGMVSYWHSIVTKRDIGRKSRLFHASCIRRPRYGGSRRNIAITFGVEKLE